VAFYLSSHLIELEPPVQLTLINNWATSTMNEREAARAVPLPSRDAGIRLKPAQKIFN